MENSIKILKQIELTHRGLGIAILFGIIAYLGKISVIFIGEKGMGKSTSISAIHAPDILPSLDISIDNLTLTELANQNQFAALHDQKMIWRIKEWSTMNKYNRELFTTMASKIITEKEYFHYMGKPRKDKSGVEIPNVIDIKNTDLIVYVGIQPLKMARMMRENENWESLTSDRFMKWIMLNSLRKDSNELPPKYDMPDVVTDFIPEFKTDMKLTKGLLHNQLSPERVPIFAKHLLTGYAILENIPELTLSHEIEFSRLFKHFIQLYPHIVYSRDIAEESELAVGSMRLFSTIVKQNGISIDELQETFSVYHVDKKPDSANRPLENAREMINRHSKLLQDRRLITVIDNSPRRFYMNKPFEDFWQWYGDLTK